MPVTLDISIADKRWAKTIPDGATVKAGRSSKAHIRIEHETVSGLHFQLRNIPGGWILKDLQSTNGTFVNDEKISDIALQEGDIIKAGNCTIVFHSEKISNQADTIMDTETQ